MKRACRLVLPILLAAMLAGAASDDGKDAPRSRPVAEALRDPLPPEDLSLTERDGRFVIAGPTFEYVVDRETGMIAGLRAWRGDRDVVRLVEPARLVAGPYSPGEGGETTATSREPGRIVLTTRGTMRAAAPDGDDVPYVLTGTYFGDGVVVLAVELRPTRDVAVSEIRHELRAVGDFRVFLHKTRDSDGFNAPRGPLPGVGESVAFPTLTSCLQVAGPRAGLAIFTDRGATRADEGLDAAVATVTGRDGDDATVALTQYVVRERPSENGFRIRGGETFAFRAGVSVVPNRVPRALRPDLRMFAWIGDDKNPYPSDAEIRDVAALGYTLFQMHRLGTPGEPRPPAEELDRVIRAVHETGMLFIWTANADLMYAHAPAVRELRDGGKWDLWRGFNYGGRYTDSMDSYCDLVATCLASPNGLADYRIATIGRMLDRHDVDGMYIDDNLAYVCSLAREHGHPEAVYDSLIELHEMNWRRRRALLARRPHAVLIDHCARAALLPVIADFDGHLHGEGYTFASPTDYWREMMPIRAMDAQACLWPGDSEPDRNATEAAYNLDLLTGGGQYMYLDWRLYPEKFSHASGVGKDEVRFVRARNLAQYGFGMRESTPFLFAESADVFETDRPGTHATIYRNEVRGDHLAILANSNADAADVALRFRDPARLGLRPDGEYVVLDADEGECRRMSGEELARKGIVGGRIRGGGLKPFLLRRLPDDAPRHLWGGQRLSETRDSATGTMTIELQGAPGSEPTVIIAAGADPVDEVRVDGEPAAFRIDSAQRAIHGGIRFGARPVRVEIRTTADGRSGLPEAPIPPGGPSARPSGA